MTVRGLVIDLVAITDGTVGPVLSLLPRAVIDRDLTGVDVGGGIGRPGMIVIVDHVVTDLVLVREDETGAI